MITVFPEKYRLRATAMRPAFGASIGVPAGLRKSAPPCELRGLPLKMLRVPNALFAACGTGRTNADVHNRLAADDSHVAASNADSRSMRGSSDAGGVTNAWINRQAPRAEGARHDLQVVGPPRDVRRTIDSQPRRDTCPA